MFGKPKAPGSDVARPAAGAAAQGPSQPASATARPPRGAELPRRGGNYAPPGGLRGDQRMPAARPVSPERQLVVGREISLSGEIKACETLIVEGRVAADLRDCKALRIAVSGLYKGTATVEQADVAGHFDGELTVAGILTLRSTGRVNGRLRYGEMEIERGGKVSGTLEDIPPAQQPAAAKAPAQTKPPGAEAPATRAAAPAVPAAPAKPAEPDDLVTRAQSGGA